MDAREEFAAVLAQFTADAVIAVEKPDAETATFEVGDVVVNLHLLPESRQVMAWSTLGFLGTDENAPSRLVYLMRLNDELPTTGGFTFSLDPADADRVLAHDVRPLAWFTDGDLLAAWIEALVDLIEGTRAKIDEACPFVDDEPLEPVFEEVK